MTWVQGSDSAESKPMLIALAKIFTVSGAASAFNACQQQHIQDLQTALSTPANNASQPQKSTPAITTLSVCEHSQSANSTLNVCQQHTFKTCQRHIQRFPTTLLEPCQQHPHTPPLLNRVSFAFNACHHINACQQPSARMPAVLARPADNTHRRLPTPPAHATLLMHT